jgi:hypothetical protein
MESNQNKPWILSPNHVWKSHQNRPYVREPIKMYQVVDVNTADAFSFWCCHNRVNAESIVKEIKKYGRQGVIKEVFLYNK